MKNKIIYIASFILRIFGLIITFTVGSVTAESTVKDSSRTRHPVIANVPNSNLMLSLSLTKEERINRNISLVRAAAFSREGRAALNDSNIMPKHTHDPLDSLGASEENDNGQRRIGGQRSGRNGSADNRDVPGFNDPFPQPQPRTPHSRVVGPGQMPSQQDLAGQDSTRSAPSPGSMHHVGPSRSSQGITRERTIEQSSRDGLRTWGSQSFRDDSGNRWSVDYHDNRQPDGAFTTKETVSDGQGKPVETTTRGTTPEGTAKETKTNHETGEVTTRTGTIDEIFPERYQPAEGGGGTDSEAPRGWFNPITGVVRNSGIATDNDQVNPGREGGTQTPATPLKGGPLVDPQDLAVNPPIDGALREGQPRDLRREHGGTIIDPPRP